MRLAGGGGSCSGGGCAARTRVSVLSLNGCGRVGMGRSTCPTDRAGGGTP